MDGTLRIPERTALSTYPPLRCPEFLGLWIPATRKVKGIMLNVQASKSPTRNLSQKVPKKQHHLWKRKSTSGSGQKARVLVDTVLKLPNEKEAVYGALDQWVAWEEEFPLIAAAKALGMLRQRSQWRRAIQVAKWMLSKGQGMTMNTYDTMLLAFDMEGRVDEAQALWDKISLKYTTSVPRMLFFRMISMYERHNMPEKLLQECRNGQEGASIIMFVYQEGACNKYSSKIFADMEELGVKPDEGTMKKIACAFLKMGFEDKHNEVLKKYRGKWEYFHFKGEQVRVRVEDANKQSKD